MLVIKILTDVIVEMWKELQKDLNGVLHVEFFNGSGDSEIFVVVVVGHDFGVRNRLCLDLQDLAAELLFHVQKDEDQVRVCK